MPISHSFSSLDADDSCPEKGRRLFVLKDLKRTFVKTLTDGINEHEVLDQRCKGQKLPPQLAHAEPFVRAFENIGPVESEVSLGVDHFIRPAGFFVAWLRGKFDVIVRDRAKRKAVIGDWKTGKIYEKEKQLEIGALLLMASDPEIDEVTGMNIWLAARKPGIPYVFKRATQSPRWAKLIRQARDIEGRDPQKPWPKKPGPLCGWCPVNDCEHYRGG